MLEVLLTCLKVWRRDKTLRRRLVLFNRVNLSIIVGKPFCLSVCTPESNSNCHAFEDLRPFLN